MSVLLLTICSPSLLPLFTVQAPVRSTGTDADLKTMLGLLYCVHKATYLLNKHSWLHT